MSKRFIICILVIFGMNLFIPKLAFADEAIDPSLPPLTLSPAQATKLKQIFPNKITEMDAANAAFPIDCEHLVWQKIPLSVVLPIKQERIIRFPEAVQFGYDSTVLQEDTLSVQNVNGVVYLIAKKSFTDQRIFVRLKQSGELVLLNLSASDGADKTPIAILLPSNSVFSLATPSHDETQILNPVKETKETLDYVDLTRFAIQQLYAPKRLLTCLPCVTRVPMHTRRTVAILSGAKVMAMPLISWRSGDLYVTALEVRNRLNRSLVLDPRQFCGHWKTTAFFPQTCLKPCGSAKDTTTVFLTSDQPFTESLGA